MNIFIAIGIILLITTLIFFYIYKIVPYRELKKENKIRIGYIKSLELAQETIPNYDEVVHKLNDLNFLSLFYILKASRIRSTSKDKFSVYKDDIPKYKTRLKNYMSIDLSEDIYSIVGRSIDEGDKMMKEGKLYNKYDKKLAEKLVNRQYFMGMKIEQVEDMEDTIPLIRTIEMEYSPHKKKITHVYGHDKFKLSFVFDNGLLASVEKIHEV